MRRQLVTGLLMTVALLVLMGLAYPLAVTGVAQVLFDDRADGSLVEDASGAVVGSALLGQGFTEPQYFHPRPSAAGDGYDPLASGGSNLGPSNDALVDAVAGRVTAYRAENGLGADTAVPIDAVTTSASGLDPHISVANARLQAGRVASARGLPLATVLAAIDDHTQGRQWGFLGEPGVNVLELNLALDRVGA
jgi:K+-transporting ATPase ATPase C chain